SNSSLMPVPTAVMIVRISSFDSTLSMRAFSTLMILPRTGRISWNSRFRPCLAEPPAESPSPRQGSHIAGEIADVERRLAAREVARLAGRLARARRRHRLLDHDVRGARMLLEILGE